MGPLPSTRRAGAPPPRVTVAVLALLLSIPAAGGAAQLVTPRTVPVHQSDQFALFPSRHRAMGGASLALDDTLHDPFVNPAKAARLHDDVVFAEAYFHTISGGRGGGRTIPVGGLFARGRWAGAELLAFQQLDRVGPGSSAVHRFGFSVPIR